MRRGPERFEILYRVVRWTNTDITVGCFTEAGQSLESIIRRDSQQLRAIFPFPVYKQELSNRLDERAGLEFRRLGLGIVAAHTAFVTYAREPYSHELFTDDAR